MAELRNMAIDEEVSSLLLNPSLLILLITSILLLLHRLGYWVLMATWRSQQYYSCYFSAEKLFLGSSMGCRLYLKSMALTAGARLKRIEIYKQELGGTTCFREEWWCHDEINGGAFRKAQCWALRQSLMTPLSSAGIMTVGPRCWQKQFLGNVVTTLTLHNFWSRYALYREASSHQIIWLDCRIHTSS